MDRLVSVLLALLCLVTTAAIANTNVKTVKRDDAEISYTVSGEGKTALVFIHCWSCDNRYWREQIQPFSKKYKVINLDLAGHGLSKTSRTEFTVDDFAEDVAAVVTNEKLNKAILVGHSMGGTVMVEAARLLPDNTLGLVAVDTLFDVQSTVKPEFIPKIMNPFNVSYKQTTERFVDNLFIDSTNAKLAQWIRADMTSAPETIALNSFEHYLKYYSGSRSVDSFKDLNMPLISINAKRRPTNEAGNKEVVGGYQLVFTDNTGHFPMLEKPDNFNQLLANAIEQIETK